MTTTDGLPPLADPALEAALVDRFGPDDGDAMLARIRHRIPEARRALDAVFGAEHDVDALLDRAIAVAVRAAQQRRPELRRLDRRREIDPTWFQAPDLVGYVTYVDRFAGDLAGVRAHLDHFSDLGVTYLHLMSVLEPRPGDSDGGFAIVDHRRVDPRLGDMDELEALADELRDRGISLCVDVVLNHTAREHPWAVAARAGDERRRAYYRVFPDRSLPDRYEATLPEVFPTLSPGNFTWDDDLDAWVWTTFRDFQWDLDHANPDVFLELLDLMCFLANRGIEVLRLDAVPFIWKRLGTDCQNQPEAHLLTQAWRALLAVAAPATICKAEAIVPPGQLVQYLGAHAEHRHEADLAYHNQLMVMAWSSLATRRADLATTALARMRTPPAHTAWCTYVRCHDDIGWAVDDPDAHEVGLDPAAHRAFLAEFFRGDFAGSYASGEAFMTNPAIGDERTSGMTASLAGLTRGIADGDPHLVDLAIRRIRLLHGLIMGWGGIPLIWMGDEIGLLDDEDYGDEPDQRGDSRWRHRPHMDWALVRCAVDDPDGPHGRVLRHVRHLATTRARCAALRSGGTTVPRGTDDPNVLAWFHRHPEAPPLVGLANLVERRRHVDGSVLEGLGSLTVPLVDALDPDRPVVGADGRVHLEPLDVRWVVAAGPA